MLDPIKIPQNVYVEDRIIGSITLRQIIICTLGGGFSYALWARAEDTYGSVNIPMTILLWTPALIAAAFAFLKIHGLSLLQFCLLYIESKGEPQIRQWTPRLGIVITIQTHFEKRKNDLEKKTMKKSEMKKLGDFLDTASDSPKMTIEREPVDRSHVTAKPPSKESSVRDISPSS